MKLATCEYVVWEYVGMATCEYVVWEYVGIYEKYAE